MSAEKVIPINDEVKETLRVEEVQLDENQQPVEIRVVEQMKEENKDERITYDFNELAMFDEILEDAHERNIFLQLNEDRLRRKNQELSKELNDSKARLDFQNKAMMVGGGVAGALSIAAILGYVRERKVHQQIVSLIEETAVLLAQEQIDNVFVSFKELITHISLKLSEFEVRSWRHPFAIPAKELEETTALLIGMLRTAEQLGFNYAKLDTANVIDVEAKQ